MIGAACPEPWKEPKVRGRTQQGKRAAIDWQCLPRAQQCKASQACHRFAILDIYEGRAESGLGGVGEGDLLKVMKLIKETTGPEQGPLSPCSRILPCPVPLQAVKRQKLVWIMKGVLWAYRVAQGCCFTSSG